MRKYLLSIGLFLIGILGSMGSPQVNAADANSMVQKLEVFGIDVRFPMPSWVFADFRQDHSEVFYEANEKVVIFEQIPKGENFRIWSQMLAVGGQQKENIKFDNFVGQSVGIYAQACGGINKLRHQVIFDGHDVRGNKIKVIGIVCPNTIYGPKPFGYGDGVGEVTIMFLAEAPNTLIKVYHHWRGAAFKYEDRQTWPVTEGTFKMTSRRFRNITIGLQAGTNQR